MADLPFPTFYFPLGCLIGHTLIKIEETSEEPRPNRGSFNMRSTLSDPWAAILS